MAPLGTPLRATGAEEGGGGRTDARARVPTLEAPPRATLLCDWLVDSVEVWAMD